MVKGSDASSDNKGEIEFVEGGLREAFTKAEPIAFDPDSVKESVSKEIDDAPEDQQDALRARWQQVIQAEQSFQRLQQDLSAGLPNDAARAAIAAQVREVAGLLNAPEVRASRPAIDAEPLVPIYTDPSRWKTASPSEPKLNASLGPILERARRLQQKLDKSSDPAGISKDLGELMDGLRARPDLQNAMGTGQYREIVATVDRGFDALKSNKAGSPEDILRLNTQRSSLDERLSAIMDKQLAVPSPSAADEAPKGAPAPSKVDELTVAFHASLRELFPKTAETIWSRMFPGSSDKADPEKTARYAKAVGLAVPEFKAEFAKVPDKEFAFTDGFDGAYASRIGAAPNDKNYTGQDVSYGAATSGRLKALQDKYASISILPSFVSDTAERLTLAALRVSGMMQNAKPGQFVVPKHFPGGPPELELTEGHTVVIPGGTKELITYLAPFLAVLHLQPPPPALMIGHAVYPDWEKELSGRWPNLKPMCGSCAPPASLSPLVLRGFLREGLHYRGLLIADWMDMGAIKEFVGGVRSQLPEDCRGLSIETLVLILGTRAGLNWMPGFPTEGAGMAATELLAYYISHKDFARQFDDLIAETNRLRGTTLPAAKDPYNAMRAKINILTQGTPKAEQANNWTDVWSRGGLLILSFRISILNNLYGEHFPNLADMRKKAAGTAAEDLWVKTLQADPKFNRLYKEVDWESPEMRQALLQEFQSMSPAGSTVPLG